MTIRNRKELCYFANLIFDYNANSDLISCCNCCCRTPTDDNSSGITSSQFLNASQEEIENYIDYPFLLKPNREYDYICVPTMNLSVRDRVGRCDYFNKTLWININKACNLNCNHCQNPHSYNKTAIDVENKLYECLSKMNKHFYLINTTGRGEPLTNKNLLPLLFNIHNTSKIQITTNGTLLTREMIDEINYYSKKNEVVFELTFSIDGIDEESYRFVRHNDKFNHILECMTYLQTLEKLNPYLTHTINYCISRKNNNLGITKEDVHKRFSSYANNIVILYDVNMEEETNVHRANGIE